MRPLRAMSVTPIPCLCSEGVLLLRQVPWDGAATSRGSSSTEGIHQGALRPSVGTGGDKVLQSASVGRSSSGPQVASSEGRLRQSFGPPIWVGASRADRSPTDTSKHANHPDPVARSERGSSGEVGRPSAWPPRSPTVSRRLLQFALRQQRAPLERSFRAPLVAEMLRLFDRRGVPSPWRASRTRPRPRTRR
jgi:hypothetical protein